MKEHDTGSLNNRVDQILLSYTTLRDHGVFLDYPIEIIARLKHELDPLTGVIIREF